MKPFNSIARLLILLLFASQFSANYAEKKIFVVSDIHVMDSSLLDSPDNAAWQEDLAKNKKMQDLSIPAFDALVEIIIQEHPDLVLITGDLTKDGEIESHDYVLKKLTEIEASDIPVYVIPGNHDRGWQEDAKKYENNTWTATKYMSESRFLSYYEPFGYGEGSEIHEGSLSYVTEPFPGLTLIGVDSGQEALVKEEIIKWLGSKLLQSKEKGNQVLVMTHHSVLSHFYGQESFQPYSVIQDEEPDEEKELSQLATVLLDGGAKVVLTGHYHVSDITRYQQGEQELYDVGTGSPISYPCDYRILTFDDQFRTLNIVTKSIEELSGYEDFPTYAKERLQASVYNWALRWLSEHVEDQTVNQLLARLIANAFVIHAEGNEPENPASAEAILLFEGITALSPIFDDLIAILVNQVGLSIKSMLGDYPSEHDKDNVVNDRELTITMPTSSPTTIKPLHQSSHSDESWYTLQGVRLPAMPTKPGLYIQNGVLVPINQAIDKNEH